MFLSLVFQEIQRDSMNLMTVKSSVVAKGVLDMCHHGFNYRVIMLNWIIGSEKNIYNFEEIINAL